MSSNHSFGTLSLLAVIAALAAFGAWFFLAGKAQAPCPLRTTDPAPSTSTTLLKQAESLTNQAIEKAKPHVEAAAEALENPTEKVAAAVEEVKNTAGETAKELEEKARAASTDLQKRLDELRKKQEE